MKLEIKLKDPKYCDGCPCVFGKVEEFNEMEEFCLLYRVNMPDENGNSIRPQKCIKENGR